MRGLKLVVALIAALCGGSFAWAENPEHGGGPSTVQRLSGATFLRPLGTSGGYLSVGGSTLRYLAPGGRRWTALHAEPGDNLYRLGVDAGGKAVIAAWEKDASLHYFVPGTTKHLRIAKPKPPVDGLELFRVEALELGDGAAELYMAALPGKSFVYRVALDGSEVAPLYQRETGQLLATEPGRAVFALPHMAKGQRCDPGGCSPVGSLVAYERSGSEVTQRVLFAAAQGPLRTATRVPSLEPGVIALELEWAQGRHALLRYGAEKKVEVFELPAVSYSSQPTGRAMLAGDELVSLKTLGPDLELHRVHLGETTARTSLLTARHNWSSKVYGFGVRKNGEVWIHWGDHLALVDSSGELRGVEPRPLLGPGSEWAGADLYVDDTALWIGVEVGHGRDLARLKLAEAKTAPWPPKPKGCSDLPPVKELLTWPAQTSCPGKNPGPVIQLLPDGTKIVDGGVAGCQRVSERPCYTK